MSAWKKNLEIYDQVVAKCPDVARKGKTVPYTSANGYMFSLLNKDGELGIRFSKERQKELLEEHQTTLFRSYDSVMRGYILIPDGMLADLELLSSYLNESYHYVMSLKPK